MLGFIAVGIKLKIIIGEHMWIVTACWRLMLLLFFYLSMALLGMDY